MCPHPGTGQQQAEDIHRAGQGVAQFTIRFKSTQLYLALHVVSGTGPNLLGSDLITPLGVDLDNLKEIRSLRAGQPFTGVAR